MVRYIVSAICLLAAGTIFFVYTQPTYDAVKTVNAQVAQYDAALSKASELQQRKQTLLSQYNTFSQSNIDDLTKLLPDHVDNIRLILDVDSLATKHGMAIQNVVVSSNQTQSTQTSTLGSVSSSKQKYDSLTVKFSTQASYETFRQFLNDLETSLRIVDLVSLSITRSDNGQLYSYDVTLRTYWLK